MLSLVAACAVAACACGRGPFGKQYEYEEQVYLSLDGSATVYVHASVAALVALRGADLDVNPRARVDRARVRALFEAPGVEVSSVNLSRRDGRRFVHVRIDTDDIRRLSRVGPLSWSTYEFVRRGELMQYRQTVGPSAGRPVGDVGWTGEELVAFRLHIPSEIPFHNAGPGNPKRGNIVEWEQPLAERLRGVPLDLQVQMEPETILYSTLLLFGSTVLAAAAAFALAIWLMVRRGAREPAGAGPATPPASCPRQPR